MKKTYFAILKEKDITNDRKFWDTAELFLSDKIKSRKSIILVEKEKTILKESQVANPLNDFFSSSVKNLEISAYCLSDTLHHKLFYYITSQAIIKYRNH